MKEKVSVNFFLSLLLIKYCIVIEAEVLDKRDDGITVPGSGPIFLSTLDCDANMDNILSCRRSAPIGITNCMHSQDVYVRCQGKMDNHVLTIVLKSCFSFPQHFVQLKQKLPHMAVIVGQGLELS